MSVTCCPPAVSQNTMKRKNVIEKVKEEASISVFCGIILRRHHKTSSFPGTSVHRLHNVYHLLLVLHCPVDLIVVAGAQINHDVFVPGRESKSFHLPNTGHILFTSPHHRQTHDVLSSPEKEHDGTGVVQLVHLVEVRHLCDVDQVDDGKVFYLKVKGGQCVITARIIR